MIRIDEIADWFCRNPLLAAALGLSLVAPGQAAEIGQLKWRFPTTEMPMRSSPAIGTDGTVYIGSWDRNVYALDGRTGAKKWSFATGNVVDSSPAIGVDGTVYIGSWDGNVYALDGATGAKKWSFGTDHDIFDVQRSSPAVGSDGTVYIGLMDHRVYALDGVTGAKKWSYLTDGEVYSSPALGTDGMVYIGSWDGNVYAFDGATGAKKWNYTTGGMVDSSPAVGSDGTVFIGSGDGNVYALDGATGAKKWNYTTGRAVSYSSPAIGTDGTVYIGSCDGNVYALDGATGAKKWSYTTGGIVDSSPAIGMDGTVYIGSGYEDNCVYALDTATGAKKWSYGTSGNGVWTGGVSSSPTIGADGTVYFGSNVGTLYAVQGSSGLANSPWPKFRRNARNSVCSAYAPLVRREPVRMIVNEGSTCQVEVEAFGDPTPSLSWFHNGLPIAGATQASLTISSAARTADGIYTLLASNTVGQATSKPIIVLVSNVKPQQWMGLKWESGTNGLVTLESATQLGASASWHSLSNYPSNGTTQTYVETSSANAARFYRLSSAEATPISGAGFVNGWSMTEPAGTRLLVEVTSEVSGWTNWEVLTNLTLPASPHLFLDLESLGAPERVYRTTVVP